MPRPPMTAAQRHRRADAAFAVVVMAIAALAFTEAQKLPPSRFDPLGAGSFPLAIAGMLFVAAALALVLALAGRGLGRAETALIVGLDEAGRRRPGLAALAFLCVCAYAAALQWSHVGYFPATAVLIAVLGIAMGPRTPRSLAVALAVGVGVSGTLTLLFGTALRLLLP